MPRGPCIGSQRVFIGSPKVTPLLEHGRGSPGRNRTASSSAQRATSRGRGESSEEPDKDGSGRQRVREPLDLVAKACSFFEVFLRTASESCSWRRSIGSTGRSHSTCLAPGSQEVQLGALRLLVHLVVFAEKLADVLDPFVDTFEASDDLPCSSAARPRARARIMVT